MATGVKKAKKSQKSSASKKKTKTNFTPEELRLGRRFLASLFGRILIGLGVALLLLLLSALVAGEDAGLFLLLNGMILLAAMIAFWIFLLFSHKSRRD